MNQYIMKRNKTLIFFLAGALLAGLTACTGNKVKQKNPKR